MIRFVRTWLADHGVRSDCVLLTTPDPAAETIIEDGVTVLGLARCLDRSGVPAGPITTGALLAAVSAGLVRDGLARIASAPALPLELTGEELDAVQAEVADWSGADAVIAAALNAPDPDRYPLDVPTRVKPVSAKSMFAVLSADSRLGIFESPTRPEFIHDIRAGDFTALELWTQMYAAVGIISEAEAAALLEHIRETEPIDPDAITGRSWAEANLGRHISAAEVAQARPEQE